MKIQFIKYTVIAGLCLTVIFNGCKKEETTTDNPPVTDTTPAFVFLKVGNNYKYNLKGINTPPDTGYTTIDTAMVMKVESENAGLFKIKITTKVGPYTSLDSMYVKKDKDGLWEKDSATATTFHQVIKSSPAVGDEFKHYTLKGGVKDTSFSKILAIGQSVTVGAGTFMCAKMKEWEGAANKDKNYDFTFIDLNVGLIKIESYENGIMVNEISIKSKN